MNDAQLRAHPWFAWLERRFGYTVAARIVSETSAHAIKTSADEQLERAEASEEKHRDYTSL